MEDNSNLQSASSYRISSRRRRFTVLAYRGPRVRVPSAPSSRPGLSGPAPLSPFSFCLCTSPVMASKALMKKGWRQRSRTIVVSAGFSDSCLQILSRQGRQQERNMDAPGCERNNTSYRRPANNGGKRTVDQEPLPSFCFLRSLSLCRPAC